jgi:TPR repeat protein
LKELLIKDVSLYILFLCFLNRKRLAFNFLEKDKALPLLESLEDRYINGVVSYRIGYCGDNNDFYYYAYHLFKNKDLSPEELYYMAVLYDYGRGTIKNTEKAIEYYKLAGDHYPKAYTHLGCIYRDYHNDEIAVMYFEKAAALNDPHAQCHIAYILEHGYGIDKNDNRSKELYMSAAKGNNKYAINYCKNMQWI